MTSDAGAERLTDAARELRASTDGVVAATVRPTTLSDVYLHLTAATPPDPVGGARS